MIHPDGFPPLPSYLYNGLLIGYNNDNERTAVGVAIDGYYKDEALLLRFDTGMDKWVQCRPAYASEISRYDALWLEHIRVHALDCICEDCRACPQHSERH